MAAILYTASGLIRHVQTSFNFHLTLNWNSNSFSWQLSTLVNSGDVYSECKITYSLWAVTCYDCNFLSFPCISRICEWRDWGGGSRMGFSTWIIDTVVPPLGVCGPLSTVCCLLIDRVMHVSVFRVAVKPLCFWSQWVNDPEHTGSWAACCWGTKELWWQMACYSEAPKPFWVIDLLPLLLCS